MSNLKTAETVYQLIGETPVVKLNNLVTEDMAEVYVKLEWFNPGSSVKDRIANAMIQRAEDEGILKPGDTIVEPTSGNTGIGIAMVAAAKGYKTILTMPESMSIERRKILQAYGAKLVLTPKEKGMKGAISEADRIASENGYFRPRQFDNDANPTVHYLTTGPEILKQVPEIDAFVAGVGTGGTITGVGRRLKEEKPSVKVIAVEPENSDVLSGGTPGPHTIQGIGAGFVPNVLNTDMFDEVLTVANDEAFEMAREVAKKEGLLVGISSGANIASALKVAQKLGKGHKVVTVSPSNGERYLSTALYNFE
jgi:cysteine synthase A